MKKALFTKPSEKSFTVFIKRNPQSHLKGYSPYQMEHSEPAQRLVLIDTNKIKLIPCGIGAINDNCRQSEGICLDIEASIFLLSEGHLSKQLSERGRQGKPVIIICGGTVLRLLSDKEKEYIPYLEYCPGSVDVNYGIVEKDYAEKIENAFLLVY